LRERRVRFARDGAEVEHEQRVARLHRDAPAHSSALLRLEHTRLAAVDDDLDQLLVLRAEIGAPVEDRRCVVGLDLDKDVVGILAEKKASDLILWDSYSEDPDLEDLQYWATELDLEFPVLADPGGKTGEWYGANYRSWSTGILIDRGMVLDVVGDATIEDALALVE
jgi:hypothetical protein